MSATARDHPVGPLDETIAHLPPTDAAIPGQPRPADGSESPARGQHRYTFGSGARPLEGYTIKRAIGRGGFGEVYFATSDAGKEVALKLITRHLEVERRGVVQCMNLKSPHLITIYDMKTSEAGDPFVIMEYVAGPSLAQVLRAHPDGLPPLEVRSWLRGLVEGVVYLHDHGIVHRDLKPANLFMEQGTVKIGDYGLTKLISESRGSGHTESIGTCHYMAPEISSGRYHKPIDIYAIGVILFEMLTGRVPFDGESVAEILMKHLTARPDLSGLAMPYRAIVAKALAKDPAHRPANAYALLPPDDAPRSPEVRYIGEKNHPVPPPEARASQPRGEDEIHWIGPEEPDFYIGPNTRPPAQPSPRPGFRDWLWGRRPANDRGQAHRAVYSPAPPARRPTRPRVPTPPTPVSIPTPEPPPLPVGRVRVAELATSMLWATPIAALLAFPAGAMLGINLPDQPQNLAFLFGMTLLGAWGMLASNTLWEGREVDGSTRRFAHLAVGAVIGTAGLVLADWTQLQMDPAWRVDGPWRGFSYIDHLGSLEHPSLPAFAVYFALLCGLINWPRIASRARTSRFRIRTVVGAALIGLGVGAFWPFPQPWGLAIGGMVAMVVQLVSPWNETAIARARTSA